jgi:hypothetical protein
MMTRVSAQMISKGKNPQRALTKHAPEHFASLTRQTWKHVVKR